jgi:hypothetical protein
VLAITVHAASGCGVFVAVPDAPELSHPFMAEGSALNFFNSSV